MRTIVILIVFVTLLILSLCSLFRRSRWVFVALTNSIWNSFKSIGFSRVDNEPLLPYVLGLLIAAVLAVLISVFNIVVLPTYSIIKSIKDARKIDDEIAFEKELAAPRPVKPKKTTEEFLAEEAAWREMRDKVRFTVPRDSLGYDPDEHEIFFYTPETDSTMETVISDNLDEIKAIFEACYYHFFFLPEFNSTFSVADNSERFVYYNPRSKGALVSSNEILTYMDIKTALSIPDKVDAPCLIRCKIKETDPVIFTFWKIEVAEGESIVDAIKEYFNHVGDGNPMYSLSSDEEIRHYLEGLSADERFQTDVLLISKEIRERIELLRAKGLSTLAIRKLIGDDSDKPGKLLIDRYNRLILTDYGNKEIKLSPIHKAVFFLFLRHPEGIYFKDLGNYKDELGRIYREITGRDNMAAVEDSINRLTNPYDNSINEKCARIKNAFVSEFREEVAQWYFIDGSKGEKKSIKLPRELVTWEIKD